MSDLRTRIAAAITDSITDQAKTDGYSHRYTPMDDDGNDLPERIGLDCSIDPALVADAVIRELALIRDPFSTAAFHRYVTQWQPVLQRLRTTTPPRRMPTEGTT